MNDPTIIKNILQIFIFLMNKNKFYNTKIYFYLS